MEWYTKDLKKKGTVHHCTGTERSRDIAVLYRH